MCSSGEMNRNEEGYRFRLFDDFWNRFLPAKERGENPPSVIFDAGKEK